MVLGVRSLEFGIAVFTGAFTTVVVLAGVFLLADAFVAVFLGVAAFFCFVAFAGAGAGAKYLCIINCKTMFSQSYKTRQFRQILL
ncbi:MAG: hypothetical protein HLUCCA11_20140 [Phormidesmis priestleyi Ana]|uniref:Uncharacterized protein n=1 Tax=Phormidesmis priestleyi Ana TaxID=1666911 RepID=A0A0P7ZS70_9CYAN|nr:MAG: hypothetical protein HLUCCA11_20140 [Phormidesmis priestleyi Ana]